MSEQEFYEKFVALLKEIRPIEGLDRLQPDTHLWATGHLDSLAVLEVIFFLEGLVGRELQLSGDFLPTFFTMRSIYENHLVQESTTA